MRNYLILLLILISVHTAASEEVQIKRLDGSVITKQQVDDL